jgi:hypothetical protein
METRMRVMDEGELSRNSGGFGSRGKSLNTEFWWIQGVRMTDDALLMGYYFLFQKEPPQPKKGPS